MLGKLLKNELKSYRFSYGIILLTAVLVTLCMKIVSLLPYQRDVKIFVHALTGYGYYYIILIANVAALVLTIIRFYSTMVGDRGYLTWTLPASSETHISVKLIGATLMRMAVGIVTIILMLFFYSGRYWGFYEEFQSEFGGLDTGNLVIEMFQGMLLDLFGEFEAKYILTIFIVLLVGLFSLILPMLLFYLCIAIGQLFGKWRILASVGAYFGIMLILQIAMIVGMILILIPTADNPNFQFFSKVSEFAAINIVLLAILFLQVVGVAIFFALTNWIFKKHLNLE